MKKHRILIVSDDDNLNFIKNHLEEKDNIVDITDDTKEALKNIGKYKYDLFIIDLDCGCLFLCEIINEYCDGFIISISSNDDEALEVKAFDCGCDDYIIKPIKKYSTLSRIQYFLKRVTRYYDDGNIIFDKQNNIVFINGRSVELTSTESKILNLFLKNKDKIITKEMIIQEVWGWNQTDASAVSTNINRLRNKIGEDKIITIRGRGYKFYNH